MMKNMKTRGLRSSWRSLRSEMRINLMHLKGRIKAKKYRYDRGLRLHLGGGHKTKKDWLNIDLSLEADLTLDMREPLPFSDNSCSIVYSEHLLEHLDYPGPATSFLKECCRVLQPDGIFNVGVPDTEWPIMEYAGTRDEGYFLFAKQSWHPKWCETKMEHINHHFRQGMEHRFAYDFVTLKSVLKKAGFVNVNLRQYDEKIDSEDRKRGTLYVDAKNPRKN